MSINTTRLYLLYQWPGNHLDKMINMNILAFRIVGVKTNYSTKEIRFFVCFFKGGAHATVAPPGYGLGGKSQ